MSTRSTISYGEGYQLYHELMEGDDVWLELDNCQFEASQRSVTVRIPLAVWETIRTSAGFTPQYHDKSDQELLDFCTHQVDERIRMLLDAPENRKSLVLFIGSAAYGGANNPREQQIEQGMEYLLKRRAHERDVLRQIHLLSHTPSEAPSPDPLELSLCQQAAEEICAAPNYAAGRDLVRRLRAEVGEHTRGLHEIEFAALSQQLLDVQREFTALRAKHEALVSAAQAELATHDAGHSPCCCVELRGAISAQSAPVEPLAEGRRAGSNPTSRPGSANE